METLWPLPLTLFESYMLEDDSPRYPMTFFLDLELSGTLYREPFELAFREAVVRHPLLRAVVQRSFFRPAQWNISDKEPELFWGRSFEKSHASRWIDLTRFPGVKAWVSHQADAPRVTLLFHHAATDGVGAIRFIGDLLALYGRKTVSEGEERPELQEINQGLLHQRGIVWPEPEDGKRVLTHTIKWIRKMLTGIPRPLRPRHGHEEHDLQRAGTSAGEESGERPGDRLFISRQLDRLTTTRLKAAAVRNNSTLNDLCLLAMFRMLNRWNRSHARGNKQESLRLLVPFSLRTLRHDELPAANGISFLFINQQAGKLADSVGTIRHIQRTIEKGNRSAEGCVPLLLFGGVAKYLPWVYRRLRHFLCYATATTAYVGDIRRSLGAKFPLKRGKCVAGSVTLEAVRGAAPFRHNTRLGASLGLYAGTLYINLNPDPHWFSAEQRESMADMFVSELEQLAQASSEWPASVQTADCC